uniref:Shootin-1 n=1 Tax=Syphacia muris TaxID=451379 RepID=A0A0N5AE51_9BILA
MASMEAHHNRYLEELSTKTNQSLSQLTKKLEMAEKEKNDTVVRYAIREAEIMRLKSDNEKYSKEVLIGVFLFYYFSMALICFSSLRRAEEAEKDAEAARSNMDQAELEANECRRQAERMLEVTRQLTERNSALSSESGSTSSRASSVSSVDLASRGTNGSPPPTTTSIENTSVLQQQMVEKIVKLQKTLAKKQEKIEFLEEHVQQCTHELCKKTKIIQNYALREEAALLLPVEDALNKVPLSRRTGGMSLMGSMFSSGDKKTELELATEVNSRLQAVLEDTLYKNITLKTNIDTLGEEIARLSRENRQLSLQKANDL